MEKAKLTAELMAWLHTYAQHTYGARYAHIEVFAPAGNLSGLPHSVIRAVPGSSSWEFKPDVVAVLYGDDAAQARLIFLNRSTSAISLKEIGEMHCYAQLANPLLAMVMSPRAASNEVNGILLDRGLQDRVLNYGGELPIVVLGWDALAQAVDIRAITPIDYKTLFA